MRWKRNNTGKHAAEKRRMDFEEKMFKNEEIQWLPKRPVLFFIIGIFILTDYLVIYQLIEAYQTQAAWISILMALATACVIDLIPAALAGILNTDSNKRRNSMAIALLIVLITFFAGLFAIRWNSQELIYDFGSVALVSQSGMVDSTNGVNTAGTTAMTVFLSILPIGTSVLSFAISLFDNKKEKIAYLKRAELLQEKIELADIEANRAEIASELARDYDTYNDTFEKLAMDDVKQEEIAFNEIVKMKMAKQVGTPQALSDFMETKE